MVFRCWERNDVKEVIGMMARMDDHAVSILSLLLFFSCHYSMSLLFCVLVCGIDDMYTQGFYFFANVKFS